MTLSSETPPRQAPRRWRIFAPTILLLALAAAWSGGWLWASQRAGETVDVWLAREAEKGRVYACGERGVGGYPFRIEIDCKNPTARIADAGGETAASAPRFLAIAHVYDPKRVIGELTGPVTISGPRGKADLSFSLAQASVRIHERRFERGSLALKTPRLVVNGDEIGTAAAFEAHLRRAPDKPKGAYDFAASVDGGVSPLFDLLPLGQGPIALDLRLESTELGELKPAPLKERLKAFAAAGGVLHVAVAKATRGDVGAFATGDLALDQEGRAKGELTVTTRGVDDMVKSMTDGDEGGGTASIYGFGAKMLGKSADLDGKPATRYRLKIDKGKVNLGPIRLTRLPPLF